MDNQFVAHGQSRADSRALLVCIGWLDRAVALLRSMRGERDRCVDVLALTMRQSALGG